MIVAAFTNGIISKEEGKMKNSIHQLQQFQIKTLNS
jgi:hypothetical protein